MPLLKTETIEQVRNAADIVEVVSPYTELRRQGQRYVGLCPFHDERTPSFSVDPQNNVYYCFGCEAGGDIFNFLQQKEGLDFVQSVEQLADRYGIELHYERDDPEREKRLQLKARALELLDKTADFYSRYLWRSQEAEGARKLLADRGLGEEVLKEFRVGYAPSAWDRLINHALQNGFSHGELDAAGLTATSRGRSDPYDRFRERITFPLADSRGRVLGFGARSVSEGQQPKYINSPDGPLYHKGKTLFGIDRARATAAKQGEVIVVEGYTDVLAMHQAGFHNTVAIMGTAVTAQQIAELARMAKSVSFALDADRAGQDAMLRALDLAKNSQLELKVIQLYADKDPCEVLQEENREAFERRVKEAVSLLEFQVHNVIEEADLGSARGRDLALAQLIPIFEKVAPSAERDEQIRSVASKLSLPEHLLASLSMKQHKKEAAREISIGPATREEAAERTFLAMCLAVGQEGGIYLERLNDDHLSSDLLRKCRVLLVENFENPVHAVASDDRDLMTLVSELVVRSEQEPSSVAKLEASFMALELRRLEREIKFAIESQDFERHALLLREREEVKKAMQEKTGAAL